MPYQKHPMFAKVETDPKAAANEIVALYARKKASQQAVAKALGCAERTIIRWIKALEEKGTNIVQRLEREKERAEKAGHPTRPAQGWRRRLNEAKAVP